MMLSFAELASIVPLRSGIHYVKIKCQLPYYTGIKSYFYFIIIWENVEAIISSKKMRKIILMIPSAVDRRWALFSIIIFSLSLVPEPLNLPHFPSSFSFARPTKSAKRNRTAFIRPFAEFFFSFAHSVTFIFFLVLFRCNFSHDAKGEKKAHFMMQKIQFFFRFLSVSVEWVHQSGQQIGCMWIKGLKIKSRLRDGILIHFDGGIHFQLWTIVKSSLASQYASAPVLVTHTYIQS